MLHSCHLPAADQMISSKSLDNSFFVLHEVILCQGQQIHCLDYKGRKWAEHHIQIKNTDRADSIFWLGNQKQFVGVFRQLSYFIGTFSSIG